VYIKEELTNSVSGEVKKVLFESDNGYSVFVVKDSAFGNVTATGSTSGVAVGTAVTLSGEWRTHEKYGSQFAFETYSESLPTSLQGIRNYLASGFIDNIGEYYADVIVDYFGDSTLRIMDNNIERLLEIDGIGETKLEKIKKAWESNKYRQEVMMFLLQYGISPALANKIYRTYTDKSIDIVKENPYKLMHDISGIGFVTADSVALAVGVGLDSPFRVQAGIIHTLEESAQTNHHCFIQYDWLIRLTNDLLKLRESCITEVLNKMITDGSVIVERDSDRVYLPQLYHAENGVADGIAKIMNTTRKSVNSDYVFESDIEYCESQLLAISYAKTSKFMVLTGGPGTGKTTTIKGMIELFEANDFSILLAAPTGRAAKRMTETTGIEAKTIHRLLEYNPQRGFVKGRNNKLCGDVLIVDEMSMVDICLMYNLIKAIPDSMTVILVGDIDQLPSVGPGNVLRNIIDSGTVPTVRLDVIFRQDNGSLIVDNAHRVNRGLMPVMTNKSGTDFFFVQENSDSEIPAAVAELCRTRLPNYFRIDPVKDIQVLSPMKKYSAGVHNLNKYLQNCLNPSTTCTKYGNTGYRIGDKVMVIQNDYDREVFNGDVGYVTAMTPKSKDSKGKETDATITFKFDDRFISYPVHELSCITLAYAATVHKSQGSEYPVVIVVLSDSHSIMLQRNLLYTAITRAKRAVVIVGSESAVSKAVRNNKVENRNTWLCQRLTDKIPK